MYLWQKIKRRGKFLLKESLGRNIFVVIYSIVPLVLFKQLKKRHLIEKILTKKQFIKHNENQKKFNCLGYTFFYNDRLPIGDIVSILLSHNKFVRKNFLDNSLLLDFEDSYEYNGVFLEKNDTVIDAGANIGLFSLYASKIIGKDGKVLAFEPIKKTSQILNQNIKINFIINIESIPLALGNGNTPLKFYVNKNSLVQSTSEIQREYTNIENVKQITLDSFMENQPDITTIDFIKADIEGAERKFLDGAKKTIQKYKPKIAICIYHLPDDPEVIEQKIKLFVPEYKIHKTKTKLFAWVEK